MVFAKGTGSPQAALTMAIGVTEIRLLIMGMPYSVSMSSPVFTSFSA